MAGVATYPGSGPATTVCTLLSGAPLRLDDESALPCAPEEEEEEEEEEVNDGNSQLLLRLDVLPT